MCTWLVLYMAVQNVLFLEIFNPAVTKTHQAKTLPNPFSQKKGMVRVVDPQRYFLFLTISLTH